MAAADNDNLLHDPIFWLSHISIQGNSMESLDVVFIFQKEKFRFSFFLVPLSILSVV